MKTRYKAILIALSGTGTYTIHDIMDATKIGTMTLPTDVTILSIQGYINSNWKTRTDGEPLKRWLTIKGQNAVREAGGEIGNEELRAKLLTIWYQNLKLNRVMRASAVIVVLNVALYIAHQTDIINGTALTSATCGALAAWIIWLYRIDRTIRKGLYNGQ